MSRKYQQRGYQDDEPRDSRRGPSPPRERSEGPRGRGLGRPTATVFRCARCGAQQSAAETVAHEAVCSGCGADLHSCTNCRYFDSGAPNECRAEIVERVTKKSTRNACELFESKETKELAADAPKAGDARSEFDSLFDF